MPTKLSIHAARRAALHCSLLDGRAKLGRGKQALINLIGRLGYIQIDTISVVERSHQHTAWVRLPQYRPGWLDHLLAAREVFEYWGHAASYLPMADYRWYLPLMQRYRRRPHAWAREMKRKHGRAMNAVLARIRDEGPLAAADFETPKGSRGPWWGWKPAKSALELLLWQGDLMVSSRRGFQRVYDLTERVLPAGVDTTMPTDDELARFLVHRALNSYGVAREYDILHHLRVMDRKVLGRKLKEIAAEGSVVKLRVEGEKHDYYALPDRIEELAGLRAVRPRLHILSPFDNLVIQRDRMRRLFSFDYSIECYTPADKRRYGYFCLPVLWGEQFAGRIDLKADRSTGVLILQGLWLENGIVPDDEFLAAFVTNLRALAEFNGCDTVLVKRCTPAKIAPVLRNLTGT